MIITIFGDVHGNIFALEKLLKIETQDTDLFISHGDVVNYGPWSNECVLLLDSVQNIKLLKGNHESFYIKGHYEGKNEVANAFFNFCYEKFNPDLLSKLSDYEDKTKIPNFTIQHTIGDQYIFEDTDIEDLKIDQNYIIGHSHQQFRKTKDLFEIYNTGSIGQNRSLINLSCYLKVDTDKKTVELKNFVHDIDKVINQMEIERYPKICIDYYRSKKRL
ncbi:metallophosphoesterase family protein [Halpernia sp. GG3]